MVSPLSYFPWRLLHNSLKRDLRHAFFSRDQTTHRFCSELRTLVCLPRITVWTDAPLYLGQTIWIYINFWYERFTGMQFCITIYNKSLLLMEYIVCLNTKCMNCSDTLLAYLSWDRAMQSQYLAFLPSDNLISHVSS